MVKINPGRKLPDNDTRTHVARTGHEGIPEAITTAKGEFECPLCHTVFKKRQDYLSHAMARHQVEESIAAGDQDQL